MKKAALTFITSAVLAFALPLYATDTPGMKSDSQQKPGVTRQRTDQMQSGQMQSGQMQSGQMQSGQQRTDQMQSGQMIMADKLQGMDVVSTEGEEIGKIKNISIDTQSGEVKFVTFSKGGILGMGAEEIAVPLSAFEFRDEKARLTVDQSKLKNVPRQSAGYTDSEYLRDLETHYGVARAWNKGNLGDSNQTQKMEQNPAEPRKVGTYDEPGMKSDSQQRSGVTQSGMKADSQQKPGVTQQRTDQVQSGQQRTDQVQPGQHWTNQGRSEQMQSGQMINADKLQGMEIVSTEGKAIGKIRNINIDRQTGEVKFVTFSRGGIFGMGAEKVAVPLSAFEFRDEKARLRVDQSKLKNVPRRSARATDSDYLRDLETHYGVAPAWERGNLSDPTQTQQMDQNPAEPRKAGTQN